MFNNTMLCLIAIGVQRGSKKIDLNVNFVEYIDLVASALIMKKLHMDVYVSIDTILMYIVYVVHI